MNFLNLIGLIVANRAEEAYDWSKNHLRQTYQLLILTFCLPFVFLAIGIGLGLAGREDTARFMVGLSGFLCALLLLLVWLRATAFAYVVVLATGAGHHVMAKVPPLTQEKADAFLKWLRGVMVWITAVCLYGMIVPIWRNLGVSLLAATCILLLAGVISARWFSGRLAQYALVVVVLMTFGVSTMTIVAPLSMEHVGISAEALLSRFTDTGSRKVALYRAEREGRTTADQLDGTLLAKLIAEQNEIKFRAINDCRGAFCSKGDETRYAEIFDRIKKIKDGAYWAKQEAEAARSADGSEDGDTNVADLPPPPALNERTEPRNTVTATDKAPTNVDEVFSELDKYGL